MFCTTVNSHARFTQSALAAMVLAVVCLATVGNLARAEQQKSPDKPEQVNAEALATMVQSFSKVEKQEHPWGWIRWIMNSKLDPKSKMTFGVVFIKPNQTNPLHIHPNCEEHLYVLSGSCEHRLGKETVVLKKGDVIRIPAGVPHKARTFEKEPPKAVIVYSSGDRQFKVVEDQPKQ